MKKRKLQLIVLLCLTLISSQSIGQTKLPTLIPYAGSIRVAIDTSDWGIVLFSFEYIKDLERTAEASASEIARLDSINEFRLDLHVSDSIQIASARVSRIARDSKADALVKEIKRQKRRKIGGTIGGFLFGFGIGVIGGWAASR